MKIYFDCALTAGDRAAIRQFDVEFLKLKELLKSSGFHFLDFAPADSAARTKLPETEDLVVEADIIMALGDSPSAGFSSVVRKVCCAQPAKICILFYKNKVSNVIWGSDTFHSIENLRVWRYDDHQQVLKTLQEITRELTDKEMKKRQHV